MADTKLSAMTLLTGAAVDGAADRFLIYDSSATLDKAIVPSELAAFLWTSPTLPAGSTIDLVLPTVDGTATGRSTSAFNCGYTSSVIGDLVYLDSAATWQKCDANTSLLYNGLLAIALEVKASGAALKVALPGSFVYATAFPTFTIGLPIYMSETAGAVTHTAPTTADSATRIIGWAIHADKLFFLPSPDYLTHI